MPAILSHHLFGRVMLARQHNRGFLTRDARDAFLLGNQGPDPLFYATRTPSLVSTTIMALRMHVECVDECLGAWRQILESLRIEDHEYEVVQSYILGYLCHFALDRTAHPLVYAYEEAICHAGVKGLSPDDHAFVHAQIESDLDVFLLHSLTGRTLEEYCIPKHVLYASDAVLSSIDTLYCAAATFFDLRVPRTVFTRSIKDMRVAEQLLYSPGGTKRSIIGRFERLIRPHGLLQALSHQSDAIDDNWYANEEKAPWLDPDSRIKRNSSYQELFDEALNTAQTDMELFKAGAPIAEISKGLDFHGARQSTQQRVSGEK